MVGWLGLVGDETVVRDHYGGREDWGGHEDGVAVDLLHGERRGDDLLLQRVSVWSTQWRTQTRSETTQTVCVCVCSLLKPYSHGLGDAHVALGRLWGDTAGGNQCLHWLVEEHAAGNTICYWKNSSALHCEKQTKKNLFTLSFGALTVAVHLGWTPRLRVFGLCPAETSCWSGRTSWGCCRTASSDLCSSARARSLLSVSARSARSSAGPTMKQRKNT